MVCNSIVVEATNNVKFFIGKCKKSLKIKAFDYPFCYKVSRLLPAKLHTQRDVFVEKDPPVGLSSIHIPTLGRV